MKLNVMVRLEFEFTYEATVQYFSHYVDSHNNWEGVESLVREFFCLKEQDLVST